MYQNYTTPETRLTLNLDFDIPMDHDARLISYFVDSIPMNVLLGDSASTGRPAYHPAVLLKMLLFAYSRQQYSGRKIQRMNEESIPMKWLTNDTPISYRTLNRFRSQAHNSELIQRSFLYFTYALHDHNLLDDETLFIDGTKVQADAYKYSFTWKKSVERYDRKLNDDVKATYQELIQAKVDLAIKEDELESSEGIETLIEATEKALKEVEQAIQEEPKMIKGGSVNKQKRRGLKKRLRKLVQDFLPRKQKYEEANAIFNGRNSFSKTDHDATFMCMKEDPMKNRELKPGYNLQIATNNQFVLAYDIFPNPTDTRTLRPFLESMAILDLFNKICADAGYGGEENYQYVLDELEKEALIPYGMYYREQSKKYRTDPSRRANWTYREEEDYYIDHEGVHFSFSHYSRRTDKNGFQRDFKIYKADEEQSDTELNQKAKTPSGRQRTIQVNYNWEYYKEKAQEALQSEEGQRIYSKRKIDVETVFGRMKRDFGVRRTHLRGAQGVRTDLGILLMSMNLTKLAVILRQRKKNLLLSEEKESKNNRLIVFTLFFYS